MPCRPFLFFALILFTTSALAALTPTRVGSTSSRKFVTSGFFEGGEAKPAVLGSIDVAQLPSESVERWVVAFAGAGLPKFRLRYEAKESFTREDGTEGVRRPARFVILFRGIRRNLVGRGTLDDIVRRSRFVSSASLYPPLDDGDTALELVLKQAVRFEPHQPAGNDGRLVLDIVDSKR